MQPPDPSESSSLPPDDRGNMSLTQLRDTYPAQYLSNGAYAHAKTTSLMNEFEEYVRGDEKRILGVKQSNEDDGTNNNPLPTHLANLARKVLMLYRNSRAARVWTVGGTGSVGCGFEPDAVSPHGATPWTYEEADVLLFTPSEYTTWIAHNNEPRPVIIREHNRRKSKEYDGYTVEQLLAELHKRHPELIAVQVLSRKMNQNAHTMKYMRTAISMFNYGRELPISADNTPVNLLSIRAKPNKPSLKPSAWDGYFDVRDNFIAICRKQQTGRTDINDSAQFRLLARRGAVSMWHMDLGGVYTYVTLCGKVQDDGEADVPFSDIKLWPVFPGYLMDPEDLTRHRKTFSEKGVDWTPWDEVEIPIIAILNGDTLVQPPGTIHAPITVTDSYMVGGMGWRTEKGEFIASLHEWLYTLRFPITTNETYQAQTPEFLAILRQKLKVDGDDDDDGDEVQDDWIGPLTADEKTTIRTLCDKIVNCRIKCKCTGNCGKDCECQNAGLGCFTKCHVEEKGGKSTKRRCVDV